MSKITPINDRVKMIDGELVESEILEMLEPTEVIPLNPVRPTDETCPTCKVRFVDGPGWLRTGEMDEKHRFVYVKCPTCSGGFESKRAAMRINDLFGDAHIPFPAKTWTFASYPKNADQQALATVKDFVQLNLAGKHPKRGLYLVGPNGRGKTSLAISALQSVIRKGHAGVFISTVELFQLLTAAIAASRRMERGDSDYQDRYEASQGAKLLRLVQSVEWLVLDDLGVEGGSKFVIKELYLILEMRRSQGLYTIFTSNCDAHSLARTWKSEQEGVYESGTRLIDRIGEYCLIVNVNGLNLRQ